MQQGEMFCRWPGLKNSKSTGLSCVHKASGNFYCSNPHCCCLHWRRLHLLPPHDSCCTSMVMPALRQKTDSVLRDAGWHGRGLMTLSWHNKENHPTLPALRKSRKQYSLCSWEKSPQTRKGKTHWKAHLTLASDSGDIQDQADCSQFTPKEQDRLPSIYAYIGKYDQNFLRWIIGKI